MTSSFDPTVASLVQSPTLQWIFVGGKGGVGKTTTSCSLATLLARTPKTRENGSSIPRRVLIVSTDPAHNLSDAFAQSFRAQPTPVNGIENLDAMELDPACVFAKSNEESNKETGIKPDSQSNCFTALRGILQQAATTLPGIDEVSVLVEIMKIVETLHYDTVVFDTAPTGHTLRLLALPQTLNDSIDRIMNVQGIQQVFTMVSSLMGSEGVGETSSFDTMLTTVNKWRENIREVQQQFIDHSKTTFVCVCIPEFLPVYETERLVQELSRCNIQCEHIVVNQVVKKCASDAGACKMCDARIRIQSKYLKQIHDLYEDFHVVEMPLHHDEIRGPSALSNFGQYLLTAYDVEKHGYL